jgi:hypothetical protein
MHTELLTASKYLRNACLATMRFPLIGQNRSIFIGNLGLFWICVDRIIGNAQYSFLHQAQNYPGSLD